MVQPWKKPFGKAKALVLEAEYEIELEAAVTGTWITAELASLLRRAFESVWEQFLNCFTDGLELQILCSLAWPEMDMMWREGRWRLPLV